MHVRLFSPEGGGEDFPLGAYFRWVSFLEGLFCVGGGGGESGWLFS